MSIHTRSNFTDLHERGIANVFLNEYPLHDTGILEQFFNVESSVKKKETEVMVAGLGTAVPISEGGDPTYDAMEQAWKVEYEHTANGLAIEFTFESIQDNLYLTLAKEGARELAKALAYTRQVQAMSFLNDETETIYSYGGTAYSLLETAHPLTNGSTWRNRRDADVVLSQEALEDAIQAYASEMVDLRGRKINVEPAFLMHGPADRFLVNRLLNSAQRAQSADNDINPLKDLNIRPLLNRHLTNDYRWFLMPPKQNHRLKFWDRNKAFMKRVDSGSNWNVRMMAYQRYSKGATSAEGIWGSF